MGREGTGDWDREAGAGVGLGHGTLIRIPGPRSPIPGTYLPGIATSNEYRPVPAVK